MLISDIDISIGLTLFIYSITLSRYFCLLESTIDTLNKAGIIKAIKVVAIYILNLEYLSFLRNKKSFLKNIYNYYFTL